MWGGSAQCTTMPRGFWTQCCGSLSRREPLLCAWMSFRTEPIYENRCERGRVPTHTHIHGPYIIEGISIKIYTHRHGNMHAFVYFRAVISEMLFMLYFTQEHILNSLPTYFTAWTTNIFVKCPSAHETRAFPPIGNTQNKTNGVCSSYYCVTRFHFKFVICLRQYLRFVNTREHILLGHTPAHDKKTLRRTNNKKTAHRWRWKGAADIRTCDFAFQLGEVTPASETMCHSRYGK